MSKTYGICLTDCKISDQINDFKLLEITNLVQVVFINQEEKKYSIKLRDESGGPGPLKFDQTIYSCSSENICLVKNELIPFLQDTDYFGRLDVLRFKKKILNLKVTSKGKLQVIYNNDKYFIECIVRHIGKDRRGGGCYVYVELTDSDFHDDTIYKLLFNQYKNEYSPSWITITVELLFTEIELSDLSNEREGYPPIVRQTIQPPINITRRYNSQDNFGKDKMYNVSNTNSNEICNDPIRHMHSSSNFLEPYDGYRTDTTKYDRRNDNPEPMDIDNNNLIGHQNYSPGGSHTNLDNGRNKAMVGGEKIANSKEEQKICFICKKRVDLFVFPCEHGFCHKCLLDRTDKVTFMLPACCPECQIVLEQHPVNHLLALGNFLEDKRHNNYLNESENQTNTSNEYSKNDDIKFKPSNREMKKPQTGNLVEVTSCVCGTSKKNYANNSCNACLRPLTKPCAYKPR